MMYTAKTMNVTGKHKKKETVKSGCDVREIEEQK